MKEFKVGDRVKVMVDTFFLHMIDLKDELGTICSISIHKTLGIEFDNKIGLHDCGGKCKMGHGYYLSPKDIELIQNSQPQQTTETETETNWQTDRYNYYEKKGWL